MRYEVEVRHHGVYVASHIALARDALTAINLIESEYGRPVWLEVTTVEGENGLEHKITLPHGWHGYSFEARCLAEEKAPLGLTSTQRVALMVNPVPARF